jgi:hypothetical protein
MLTYLFKVQEDLSQFYGALFALPQFRKYHSEWKKQEQVLFFGMKNRGRAGGEPE